eukprot:TRINITY_DN539_c0_g2_i1.p1 TRINITY_DN539_c0_g2~~TRINITY_DN539_c0_g2_i1.p1  ORF type:complete len:608 (+),score=225.18 TRINITY_DN539_c0_g2_i1:57-1826(+)
MADLESKEIPEVPEVQKEEGDSEDEGKSPALQQSSALSKSKKKKQKAKQKKQAQAAQAEEAKKAEVDARSALRGLTINSWLNQFAQRKVDLTWTPTHGRHAIAKADIAAGEIMCNSHPSACVVSTQYLELICHRCFKNADTLYVCSGCHFARFCSTQCLNAARATHHYECKTLSRFDELKLEGDTSPVRVMIRLLYLHHIEAIQNELGPRARKWTPEPGSTYQDSIDLVSHEEQFAPITLSELRDICDRVKLIMDPEAWIDSRTAVGLLLRIQCNAHWINDTFQHKRIGLGLFPAASYFNHSCEPNCVFTFQKDVMQFHALRDIRPGEPLCYSYTDLYTPRPIRQRRLAITYYFDCTCARCQQPMERSFDRFIAGFRCSEPNCGGLLQTWTADPQNKNAVVNCDKCNKEEKMSDLKDAEHLAQTVMERAYNTYSAAPSPIPAEDLQQVMNLCQQLVQPNPESSLVKLHPYHYVVFNANLLYQKTLMSSQQYQLVLEHGQTALEAMKAGFLDRHPEIADQYETLGDAYAALAKEQKAQAASLIASAHAAYQQCVDVRAICLGQQDRAYKEALKKLLHTAPPAPKKGKKNK